MAFSSALFVLMFAGASPAPAATWVGADWGGSDFVVADGDVLSGSFTGVGHFVVPAGAVVTVASGVPLSVDAHRITVDGWLDASGAGEASEQGSGAGGHGRRTSTVGDYITHVYTTGGGGAGHGAAGQPAPPMWVDDYVAQPYWLEGGVGGVGYGNDADFGDRPLGSGGGNGAAFGGPGSWGGAGGAGGGSVGLQAATLIQISGEILADGRDGGDAYLGSGGGGGSGGTIVLEAPVMLGAGNVSARGGGGGGGQSGGGAGAGGRLKLAGLVNPALGLDVTGSGSGTIFVSSTAVDLQVVGTVSAGAQVELVAAGVAPGEQVFFAGAVGSPAFGPCLWGLCLDLGPSATLLGTAVADAAGEATLQLVVPLAIQPNGTYTLQAAVQRRANSGKSPPRIVDGTTMDWDGDGLVDADELAQGSDPRDPDTDGDGVLDGVDRCPGMDDSADADADGVPDDCDICPGGDDRLDTDGDRIPDACDAFVDQLRYLHDGSTSPVDEGWDFGARGPGVSEGPWGDAWEIRDESTVGGSTGSFHLDPTALLDDAARGWRYTVWLQAVHATDPTNPNASVFFEFCDGQHRWPLRFGTRAGLTVVRPDGEAELTVGATTTFHAVELVSHDGTLADVVVDGTVVLSGYGGIAAGAVAPRVIWGSADSGGMGTGRYARVEWATTCPTGPDTDGDGVSDGCDRCEGFDDAIDVDGNGIPDGCDV
ncbi:MAG: hypothetical protein H6735_22865 [Alphaproteobacteria bacterium]|nr:hypothetical protein [Alphaproteobacteria bacterium]